ncbi:MULTISPECIES: MBL fold metallo-hydrolase [Pseudomonas]|uniref:Glyoxylase-like metal-dependent hydrolase (Beta-lactamase superfamily II) n=1 Tax=Ectopseudomonas oleovorans TaxID=301 RepID=A0A3D9EMX3_ECTOL|nr:MULTISPECIES: MBL fold metallo-hydrolase [Pseudomonas]RED04316.1 glyoxylase-like metal-dependent hydrolase (beta-lactamase superfamily II) [Pseudomonas oleovorans]
MTPRIEPFFDATTSTFTYVIYEAPGSRCAIIDSVLDYDPHSGRTATLSADRVARFVRDQGLTVEWLLETHAHADHLSAAPYLRRQLGGRIAIGEGIRRVQGAFKDVFNLEPEFRLDGSQFDHLFQPDEVFHIGALTARALHVPGHTPADMAYQVEEEHVFVGDTLFMPDVGSARCDFPGGSARDLYRSIRRLLALPEATRLYLCHDYPPAGREARHETTVGEERALNVHVRDGVDEDAFVALRTRRDATLSMPTLILPAIQVNIRAGTLPPAEANGRRYLKIPIDGF